MDVLWSAASLLVGAGVTWIVARYYYRRAAREIKEDLQSLIQEVRATSEQIGKTVEETSGDIQQMIVAFS